MRNLLLLILILVCGTASPAFAQKLDNSGVSRDMKKVLSFDKLQKSKVGIFAIDVETNEVVYSLNADEPFNPASNMKLVTAAAALQTLGPEHLFVTRISAKKTSGSTVHGLYLKGEGDPTLLWEDMLAMASEMKARGITKVTGGLTVDDTEFAPGFIPPGYDQKDEDASYRAPVGAVSVNFNSQTVVVRPGTKAGEKARVYLQPPNDHVQLVNEVKTGNGTRARVKGKSEASGDGTKITISGSIGRNAETQFVRKRIDNPSLFAGSTMAKALETVGITLEGPVKVGKRPKRTTTLVYHNSKPLAYAVYLMNKWSNNFMAEMLYRVVSAQGKPADATRSPAFITKFLKKAGVNTKQFKSFNGSGLYAGNAISPRQLVELLDWMTEQPTYPEFAAALAIAGRDGTLSKRLAKSETRGTLRGKTGTLNDVTALSGYLKTKSGRLLAYSLLINDPPVKAWQLRRVQDEMAEALANLDK